MSLLVPVEGQTMLVEQTAMRFYNSIVAADFARLGDDAAIAEAVMDGFISGQLLIYPKDKAALAQEEVTNKLPGAMRFLLSGEQVAQKSFVRYLRRGTPLDISHDIMWSEAQAKKATPTCHNECALEDYLLQKMSSNVVSLRAKKGAPEDLLKVLETIYESMLGAQKAARDAAAEHIIAFNVQISEKLGFVLNIAEEPYLEFEIKRFELQLLQTLERLANRMEMLLEGKGQSQGFDAKKIDPAQPLPGQVADQVILETSRMKGRMKQSLDRYRQQSIGVTHYIWRSRDDERVRDQHAAYDDQIFEWVNPPEGGHPGEAFGCRCWAEPVLDGAGEPKIEVASLGALRGLIIAGSKIIAQQRKKLDKLKDTIKKPLKPKSPKEILNPDGKPFGKPGRKPKVRVQEGGEKAAKELFDELSKGGKPFKKPNYPGKGMKLPNGDWVGYRSISKSGPPTVDIDVEGIPFDKIKFPN